jgi:predicted membrane protein
MLIEKKYLEKTLLGILLLTVLIDSIFIFQFFDMAYLTVAALWLLLTRSRKESPQYSYYVSFGLLIFCVISQLLNNNNIVEKSASWAFLFIVIAMAQDILLLRNEKVAS